MQINNVLKLPHSRTTGAEIIETIMNSWDDEDESASHTPSIVGDMRNNWNLRNKEVGSLAHLIDNFRHVMSAQYKLSKAGALFIEELMDSWNDQVKIKK